MTPADGPAYAAAVLILYVDLPDTPLRPSARDHWLARRFHERSGDALLMEAPRKPVVTRAWLQGRVGQVNV